MLLGLLHSAPLDFVAKKARSNVFSLKSGSRLVSSSKITSAFLSGPPVWRFAGHSRPWWSPRFISAGPGLFDINAANFWVGGFPGIPWGSQFAGYEFGCLNCTPLALICWSCVQVLMASMRVQDVQEVRWQISAFRMQDAVFFIFINSPDVNIFTVSSRQRSCCLISPSWFAFRSRPWCLDDQHHD